MNLHGNNPASTSRYRESSRKAAFARVASQKTRAERGASQGTWGLSWGPMSAVSELAARPIRKVEAEPPPSSSRAGGDS